MTRQVIRDYACPNVYLVHAAVFDEPGLTVPLYAEGHGGDSIVFERGSEVIDTPQTLTLDTFCAQFALTPDVMKLDVEGAEKKCHSRCPEHSKVTPAAHRGDEF